MSNNPDAPQQSEQEEEGLCLLDLPAPWLRSLVRQHLHKHGRLCLFQASKAAAACVQQHAARRRLTLNSEQQARKQLGPQQRALLGLLAAAHDTTLHVELQDGVPALWQLLPHERISVLTLDSLSLSTGTLLQLQLRRCTRLTNLRLLQLTANSVPPDPELQRSSWFPATLHYLHVDSSSHGLVQLLAPQLRHLVWDVDVIHPRRSALLAPDLTSLTHFAMTRKELSLSDSLLDVLAELPALRHVKVPGLQLTADHRSQGCSWRTLEITGGARLLQLGRLPLQHIGQVVVHHTIACAGLGWEAHLGQRAASQPLRAALSHLASCAKLSFVPNRSLLTNYLPLFQVAALSALELVAALAHSLPPQVVLNLTPDSTPNSRAGPLATQLQRAQYWQQLVAALPATVTGLVLSTEQAHRCQDAAALVAALSASQRHDSVVLWVYHNIDERVPAVLRQLRHAHVGRVRYWAWPPEVELRQKSPEEPINAHAALDEDAMLDDGSEHGGMEPDAAEYGVPELDGYGADVAAHGGENQVETGQVE